jgi:hypothetical protein
MEGRGEWCLVKTRSYKDCRKKLLNVAKSIKRGDVQGVPLVIEKTAEGLMFRVASAAEVEARKKIKSPEVRGKRR